MSIVAITVLDHIDNITVEGNVFEQPANEYWALFCLRQGMEFLYRQAQQCNRVMKQQANPHGNLKYVGMGNLPEMRAVPTPLLNCAFHWYAISACQYARTVGAIACRQDSTRPLPPHYVAAVMPEVLAFRDKVAAHFAWSTQHSKDNDAERLASILPPLTFEDDSFHVGGLAVALRRAGKESNSQSIAPWSICRVHERLRSRYWPVPQGQCSEPEPAAAPDTGRR
jgi:hypothetical protein